MEASTFFARVSIMVVLSIVSIYCVSKALKSKDKKASTLYLSEGVAAAILLTLYFAYVSFKVVHNNYAGVIAVIYTVICVYMLFKLRVQMRKLEKEEKKEEELNANR